MSEAENHKNKRHPNREAFIALKALQSVGGLNGKTVFWFLFLVVLVNLLSSYLENSIKPALEAIWAYIGKCAQIKPAIPFISYDRVMLVVVLIILVFFIWLLKVKAEKGLSQLRPTVYFNKPHATRVIIMFLSTPRFPETPETKDAEADPATKDAEAKKRFEENLALFEKNLALVAKHIRLITAEESERRMRSDSKSAQLSTGDFNKNAFEFVDDCPLNESEKKELAAFFNGFNWRMNIEALRYHTMEDSGNLEKVIIIPSHNESDKYVETFITFLSAFLEPRRANVDIMTPDKLKQGELNLVNRLAPSLRYHSMAELVDMLYEVNTTLKRHYHYMEDDILVDITSGKALCSAAGMAFATLVDRRRVQYVDTNDYSVNSYDVTHDVDISKT